MTWPFKFFPGHCVPMPFQKSNFWAYQTDNPDNKPHYLQDRLYYCNWVRNEQISPQNTPYIQNLPQTFLIFHDKHVRAFESYLSTECTDISRAVDVWSGSEKSLFLLDWLIDVTKAGERILTWHLPQYLLTWEQLLIYLWLKKRRHLLVIPRTFPTEAVNHQVHQSLPEMVTRSSLT